MVDDAWALNESDAPWVGPSRCDSSDPVGPVDVLQRSENCCSPALEPVDVDDGDVMVDVRDDFVVMYVGILPIRPKRLLRSHCRPRETADHVVRHPSCSCARLTLVGGGPVQESKDTGRRISVKPCGQHAAIEELGLVSELVRASRAGVQ